MKAEEEGRGERGGAEMERSETKGKRRREEKRGGEKRSEKKELKNQLSRKLLVTRIAVNLHLF